MQLTLRGYDFIGGIGFQPVKNMGKMTGWKPIPRFFHRLYAYAVDPQHCHLYNRDGLPASPFCSHPELLDYVPVLPTE
jgi:hypothetical protein